MNTDSSGLPAMAPQVARRTSSRRTLLRGGAWAVPAISVAATAPAYAASTVGFLDVTTGASSVTPNGDGSWDFPLSGASLFLESRDLQPNQLTMTVTALPAQDFDVRAGGPAGWSSQVAGRVSSATYTYGLGAPADTVIQIEDGRWFGTALDVPPFFASFQLTFEAPGFHGTSAQSIYVPTSQRLSFDPGTSSALRVPDPAASGADLWTMYFEGASVRVSGGVVSDLDLLRIGVRFVPDPGVTATGFLDTGTTPQGWSAPSGPDPHQRWTLSYDDTVDASTQDVVLSLTDGAYFTTMLPADQQSGHFELTVADPDDGFASDVYRIHVPAS